MSIKDMSKDDLELLSHKDITNILLEEKGAMNTKDLFKTITELLELPSRVFETKIGDYYTTLTTDKRFVLLEDGKWDLRDKHTSSKLVVDDEDEDDADVGCDVVSDFKRAFAVNCINKRSCSGEGFDVGTAQNINFVHVVNIYG